MTKRKSDFTLPTLDDLFTTQAERDDAKLERVKNIPLDELHPFKNHPFKILNNEEMERMIESIRKVGTITPALARPLPDGGYELISGHRRLAACQVLGIETMPVIVREMSDDEAVIQRYIRLTHLIPELLSMVDDNKIAFNPAVEISYLDRDEQLTLLDAINMNDCTPSHAQSIRLKKMSQDGLLTADAVYAVLSEEKPNQREQIKLPRDELRKYFPQNYSDEQIKRDILKGLELLKRQRERNRDAR